MLEFSEDFFKPEIRCGFVVDATMKTVWAAELEVLNEIAQICQKYNLQWFADWGTLLGAVRHKGFVPWDDDIDIALKREDYEKLIEILPRELPLGYKVQNAAYDADHEQFWSCVLNSECISIEEEHLKKYHGCPFIVGVDIFPLDNLPNDEKLKQMESALFVLIWNAKKLAQEKGKNAEQEKDLQLAVKYLEDYYQKKFDGNKNLTGQLCEMANQLCIQYNGQASDYIVPYLSYTKRNTLKFKQEWYSETIYVSFENIMIPIPKYYDEVLRVLYGDYNVVVKGNATHDYPFYKSQLEFLRKAVVQKEKEVIGEKR